MPKVNLRFWGMLKNGRLHSVYSSESAARKAIQKVDDANRHSWEILPVQVIY